MSIDYDASMSDGLRRLPMEHIPTRDGWWWFAGTWLRPGVGYTYRIPLSQPVRVDVGTTYAWVGDSDYDGQREIGEFEGEWTWLGEGA